MAASGDETNGPWETPVVREENGEPIGVTITLTADDLFELGVEFESKEKIFYQFRNRKIEIIEDTGNN